MSMDPLTQRQWIMTRRQFFGRTSTGIGVAALASMLNPTRAARLSAPGNPSAGLLPHFAPRAKRIIYLFQSGAPSQIELFDHKPKLKELQGSELPDSIRRGQRLTGMTSGQKSFPVAPSIYGFARHGNSGQELSELLPHTATVADDICIVRSMYTEAINHDPAITFITTGAQQAGRPSIGAWLSYGLGSENRDLPAFVVLISRGTGRPADQPLYDRLWGSGFLPSIHQGVKFRSVGDPVLYLSNPPGLRAETRRQMLDELAELNQLKLAEFGDPEIATRIGQYEMAYRMQSSVPDLMDISGEPQHILDLYGPDVKKPGTFAANALLARRLAERGVRFVQLFHMGWDQHADLPGAIKRQAHDTDQPAAALIHDLKQRGLFEDTLIVWAGEFGRTVYNQGEYNPQNYGRDHHPRCYSIWLAGGGIRGGITWGQTDEYSYNIVSDPLHVHDLNATILHQLGIDHEQLTYKFQGRRHRLTDVHGVVQKQLLA
jgi:hypothetical protein